MDRSATTPEDASVPFLPERYIVCSDAYGGNVRLPIQASESGWDEDWLDAALDAFDHGILHDCGHLAYDAVDRKLVFLASHALDEGSTVLPEALADISRRFGVEASLFRWPDYEGAPPPLASACAVLFESAQFPLAADIVSAFAEAEVPSASEPATRKAPKA